MTIKTKYDLGSVFVIGNQAFLVDAVTIKVGMESQYLLMNAITKDRMTLSETEVGTWMMISEKFGNKVEIIHVDN